MVTSNHIIDQASVAIQLAHCPNNEAVTNWVKQQLLSAVEDALNDQGIAADEWIILDKLSISIDLQIKDLQTWLPDNAEVTKNLNLAITKALSAKNLQGTIQSTHQRLWQHLVQYLEDGWCQNANTLAQLKQWISEPTRMANQDAATKQRLLTLLQNVDIFSRFLSLIPPHQSIGYWLQPWYEDADANLHFNLSFWQELITTIAPKNKVPVLWHQFFLHLKESEFLQLQQVLQEANVQAKNDEEWHQIAQKLSPHFRTPFLLRIKKYATKKASANARKPIETDILNQRNYPAGKMEICNAGLVLAAPFLPAFFQALQWHPSSHAQQCTLALHYIACGKWEAADWELLLPKLLCGIPFSKACGGSLSATPELKNETDALLQSIIQHWQKLGNTSIEGLRINFLQRTGMLQIKEDTAALSIAEETADILLAFVPWNFRFIKLPWMQHLLTVKWGE